jgi:hypothetical protein
MLQLVSPSSSGCILTWGLLDDRSLEGEHPRVNVLKRLITYATEKKQRFIKVFFPACPIFAGKASSFYHALSLFVAF